VPNINWYGPEFGSGSTGERVSYTRPVADKVRDKAIEIGRRAAWFLDSRPEIRREHGELSSEVEVMHWPTPGVRAKTGPNIDSHVILTDPLGKGAAAGIEKRHRVLHDAANSM
jgi:hypothetical protein